MEFNHILRMLQIGDIVYEEGGWDTEYYPQIILKIDLDRNRLFVREESIKEEKWIHSFYLFENGKYVFYYQDKKSMEPKVKVYCLSML